VSVTQARRPRRAKPKAAERAVRHQRVVGYISPELVGRLHVERLLAGMAIQDIVAVAVEKYVAAQEAARKRES
jgi:hypothetical protein